MNEQRISRFYFRLEENVAYLAEKAGAEVAWRFHQAVEDSCTLVMKHPEVGPLLVKRFPFLRRQRNLAGLRFHPIEGFENWLLIYRLEPSAVIFWSVEHCAQDLPNRLTEQ